MNKKRTRIAALCMVLAIPLVLGFGSKVSKNPIVVMETNKGDVVIELFKKEAPITVKNFLTYIDDKYYNNTIFHRVIPGFMIQGGGFNASLESKPTKQAIKNEATNQVSNKRGTIAMARTGVIDSATSQFFINVVNNNSLDHRDTSRQGFGYCVFGKVISGMQVVDQIVNAPTTRQNYHLNVPIEPIIIKTIRRMK